MGRVFVATCEGCGFAEERGQLAAAVFEADTHEGATGHRTRVVESLVEEATGRPAAQPAGPVEMPVLVRARERSPDHNGDHAHAGPVSKEQAAEVTGKPMAKPASVEK